MPGKQPNGQPKSICRVEIKSPLPKKCFLLYLDWTKAVYMYASLDRICGACNTGIIHQLTDCSNVQKIKCEFHDKK